MKEGRGLSIPSMVLLCFPLTLHAQVLIDDFEDGTTNLLLWTIEAPGSGASGPLAFERNQRLEIEIPHDSSGSYFSAGYRCLAVLRGDFDLQVDFTLLSWPAENGVRVGLVALLSGVTRVSLGDNEFPGQDDREVYATDISADITFSPTDMSSGSLRFVRSADTLAGYYWSGSNYELIGSGTVALSDATFKLRAWSHDHCFANQDVLVAFDNIMLNAGQMICPGDIDADGAVDLEDFALFANCMSGPSASTPPGGCTQEEFDAADLDDDEDVDLADFGGFEQTLSGPCGAARGLGEAPDLER